MNATIVKTAEILHTAAKQASGPAEAVTAMMLTTAMLVVEHTPADKVQDTILELTSQMAKFAKSMLDARNPVPQQPVVVVPSKPAAPKKPTPINIPVAKAPEEPVIAPEQMDQGTLVKPTLPKEK